MTTPIVTTIEPTKAKGWVALVTTVLTVAVPYILSVSTYLPDPWPAVIGGIIGLLGVVGVVKTPNHPANTSIVPNDQITSLPQGVGYTPVPDKPVNRPAEGGPYRNPWRPTP